jgi:prefoldin alpha subunit
MDQKDLQEKYLLYQILSQNVEQMKQQLQLVEQQRLDIQITQDSLRDVGKLKKENEIMIPLGSGCYAEGNLSNSRGFHVNIGSGVILKKDAKELLDFLDAKEKEIGKASKEIQEEILMANRKLDEIALDLQKHQKPS